jgi:hypothetical protein
MSPSLTPAWGGGRRESAADHRAGGLDYTPLRLPRHALEEAQELVATGRVLEFLDGFGLELPDPP